MGVEEVFRVPGRLYIGVTDLSIDPPYGGTEMGVVAEAVAVPHFRYEPVIADEYGGEPIDYVEVGGYWTFAATLREWNEDTVAAYFNATAGVVTSPTNQHPGAKVSGTTLLFAPREIDTHPAFYASRALPLIEPTRELAFQLLRELVVPVMFHCVRDAGGEQVMIGKISDL